MAKRKEKNQLAKKSTKKIALMDLSMLVQLEAPTRNHLLSVQNIKLFVTNGLAPSWLVNKFKYLGRDTETIDCKDGRPPRYRFKDEKKAFDRMFPDYLVKAKAELAGSLPVSVKGDVEIDRRKDKVIRVLNTMIQRTQTKYNNAYKPYHLNP